MLSRVYKANLRGLSGKLKDLAPDTALKLKQQQMIKDQSGLKNFNDPMPIISQGEIHGRVSLISSGDGGFGYDKIFYPSDYDCSMASINPDIKNNISHRAIASCKFLQKYNSF